MVWYPDLEIKTLDDVIHAGVDKINEGLKEDNFVVYLAYKGKFSLTISCSHNAPKSKKTNWNRDLDRPTHYPGWEGRVWVATKHATDDMGSGILRPTGIKSGTGGYGLYDLPTWVGLPIARRGYNDHTYEFYPLSYHSQIFHLDFPDIDDGVTEAFEQAKAEYEVNEVKAKLLRKHIAPFTFKTKPIQSSYVHPDYRE